MNFTDQKPRIATQKDLNSPWSGCRHGKFFACGLCGHHFKVGDKWRWIYTNNIPGATGNPLICEKCDGPDVIERWKQFITRPEIKLLLENCCQGVL